MRTRPAARLLVLDPDSRLLLFRFAHSRGPLAGRAYWATPGGALEAGETYAEAAQRELFEETGIVTAAIDAPIATREFVFHLADGEQVLAQERLFLVHAENQAPSRRGWSAGELEVMVDHRWWTPQALRCTSDIVFPEDVIGLLVGAGIWDME